MIWSLPWTNKTLPLLKTKGCVLFVDDVWPVSSIKSCNVPGIICSLLQWELGGYQLWDPYVLRKLTKNIISSRRARTLSNAEAGLICIFEYRVRIMSVLRGEVARVILTIPRTRDYVIDGPSLWRLPFLVPLKYDDRGLRCKIIKGRNHGIVIAWSRDRSCDTDVALKLQLLSHIWQVC